MPRRFALAVLGAALATLAALWLDPWVFRNVAYPRIDEHDWGRLLRTSGSIFFWIGIAAAFWLEGRRRDPAQVRLAGALVLGPGLAGLAAELLKLLIRRERPGLHDGEYYYRPFTERLFDTHDLGFPSSHVMVAFGGAAVLASRYPRVAPVGYALAAGCGITRILAQGHFLSDVVGGALGGWAVGAWVARRLLPPAPRPA